MCAKGGYDGTQEHPWPPEIYDSYWDEEEEEFVIVVYIGETPCHESDAPTRYEYHSESDYWTDSTDSTDSADSADSADSVDSAELGVPTPDDK